jgi:hypothetical protein
MNCRLKDYELEKGKLYGGLLGDPMNIIKTLNYCVASSREAGLAYPWFINRPSYDPSNDWGIGIQLQPQQLQQVNSVTTTTTTQAP